MFVCTGCTSPGGRVTVPESLGEFADGRRGSTHLRVPPLWCAKSMPPARAAAEARAVLNIRPGPQSLVGVVDTHLSIGSASPLTGRATTRGRRPMGPPAHRWRGRDPQKTEIGTECHPPSAKIMTILPRLIRLAARIAAWSTAPELIPPKNPLRQHGAACVRKRVTVSTMILPSSTDSSSTGGINPSSRECRPCTCTPRRGSTPRTWHPGSFPSGGARRP